MYVIFNLRWIVHINVATLRELSDVVWMSFLIILFFFKKYHVSKYTLWITKIAVRFRVIGQNVV